MIFEFDEGTFEIPGAWADQTENKLARSAGDGSSYAFTIFRARPPDGQSLAAFVDENLAVQAQTTRGFELLTRREITLAGSPAVEVESRWLHEDKFVFQCMAVAPYHDRVLVVTAASRMKLSESCRDLMRRVLPTLELRER